MERGSRRLPKGGKDPLQFKFKQQHDSQEHQQDPAQQGLCADETEQKNGVHLERKLFLNDAEVGANGRPLADVVWGTPSPI